MQSMWHQLQGATRPKKVDRPSTAMSFIWDLLTEVWRSRQQKSWWFPLSGSEEGCFCHQQDIMVSPNLRTLHVCLKLMPKMAGTSQRTRLCSYSPTYHSKGSSLGFLKGNHGGHNPRWLQSFQLCPYSLQDAVESEPWHAASRPVKWQNLEK